MRFSLAFCILAAVAVVGVYSQAPEAKVKVCEPDSVFMNDCNRCRCSPNGFDMACTRINCVHVPEGVDQTDRRKRDVDTCEPGSKYKVDCNECECPASGKKSEAACTLTSCSHTHSKRQASDETCTPGETFKIDCNDCVCPSSGLRIGAACTLKACF